MVHTDRQLIALAVELCWVWGDAAVLLPGDVSGRFSVAQGKRRVAFPAMNWGTCVCTETKAAQGAQGDLHHLGHKMFCLAAMLGLFLTLNKSFCLLNSKTRWNQTTSHGSLKLFCSYFRVYFFMIIKFFLCFLVLLFLMTPGNISCLFTKSSG